MTDIFPMTNFNENENQPNLDLGKDSQPTPPPYQPAPTPYGYSAGSAAPQQPSPSPYYGNVPAGYQAVPLRPTNGLATTSLILGIAQIIFGALTGIPAIITGHIALGQIKQTGQNGRGFALTGLILGYVGILFTILAAILLFTVGISAGGDNSSLYNGTTY